MTRQNAINLKCKECIYDELDQGTWRTQVENCEISDCALYEFRPTSFSRSKVDRLPVEPNYEALSGEVMPEALYQ